MELLLAVLTGFFLWLWMYDGSRRAVARSRAEAGRLHLKAGRKGYRHRYFIYGILLTLLFFQLGMQFWLHGKMGIDNLIIIQFHLALFTCVLLLSIFPPPYYWFAFEVHEKGLVARGLFVPWNEVRYALRYSAEEFISWSSRKGRWEIQFRDFSRTYYVSHSQRDAVMAALGRFVEVRDENGAVLAAPPPKSEMPDGGPPRLTLRRTRFQFDLRSMLLFLVFASTVSGIVGIQFHRWDRQRKALETLDVFKPRISWLTANVWQLDFSQSARKPSDEDLAALEQFPRLQWLDLTGAPVTDAGIKHITALKNLKFVNLTNTQVTKQGYQRLQQALPEACISWMPPNPPPLIIMPANPPPPPSPR
ncbi:MAG: hypothetical protein JXB10_13130 [Pirellulales bacterium]|nr:hypothetical protein [Pirellulales bacterium]